MTTPPQSPLASADATKESLADKPGGIERALRTDQTERHAASAQGPSHEYKRLCRRRHRNKRGVWSYEVEWRDGSKAWEPSRNIPDAAAHFKLGKEPEVITKLKASATPRRWQGWDGSAWIKLSPSWVAVNFTAEFVSCCTASPDTAQHVPVGRAASLAGGALPPTLCGSHCETPCIVPVVCFRQGDVDGCVPYSAASALVHAAAVDTRGLPFAPSIADLQSPSDPNALKSVLVFVNQHVAGWQAHKLHKHDPLANPSPDPIVLQLEDSDGDRSHAVTTLGEWIFDANKTNAVPLTKAGLDACCLGKATYKGVVRAVRLVSRKKVSELMAQCARVEQNAKPCR